MFWNIILIANTNIYLLYNHGKFPLCSFDQIKLKEACLDT